jgi:hypothetical protein
VTKTLGSGTPPVVNARTSFKPSSGIKSTWISGSDSERNRGTNAVTRVRTLGADRQESNKLTGNDLVTRGARSIPYVEYLET